MSVLSGTLGAVMSAGAQKQANDINLHNNKVTNETNAGIAAGANATNLAMFHAARGSGGYAVLPEYLKGPGGGSFERELGQQFVDDWGKLSKTNSVDRFQSEVDKSANSRAASDKAIAGIFNGDNEDQRMANLKPVEAGRVAYSRQSSMDALSKTLGEIQATQAQQGFSGDSMTNRMLTFRANKDQGDTMAGINLQNLQDERAIHDQALQDQITNSQLPYQVMANDVNALRMPQDQFVEAQMKGLQPMTFLRIGGTQPFRSDVGPGAVAPPAVQANPSAMQLAMQGISSTGNMALQYYLKQKQAQNTLALAKQLQQQGAVTGAGAGVADNSISAMYPELDTAAAGAYGYGGGEALGAAAGGSEVLSAGDAAALGFL